MSGHYDAPASAAGMEATNYTTAASTLALGHTAMADNPTAATTTDDMDMTLFSADNQWLEDVSSSINHVAHADSALQYSADSEGGPDNVNPSALTAQTPVPTSSPMAANTPVFQPELSSTLLAQSFTFGDASNSRTFVTQTPRTAHTVVSRVSQPYTPRPQGSHGPIRTTRGHPRSQSFPTPTSMQHPTDPRGQYFHESQLPVPGSLQMQQAGYGQLYEPSPQEMMQPARVSHRRAYPQFNAHSNKHSQMEYMPSNDQYQASSMMQWADVNGGQGYAQLNSHMNDHYPIQLMGYGSQPQTFPQAQSYSNYSGQTAEQTNAYQAREQQQPQYYSNIPSQMPEQTYPYQVGKQQQQIAPRQFQQPAQPDLVWIPVAQIDVKGMMMRVLLKYIAEYRTKFKQILIKDFPASFAKCTHIRCMANHVINFSMACKICHSRDIAAASETRKYVLADKTEDLKMENLKMENSKMENLRIPVEFGIELWHCCQTCHGQWNVFSSVNCRFWGEYLAEELAQGPDPNAPHLEGPNESLSRSAVQVQQSIQEPAQSAGQPQQSVQAPRESQITGSIPSKETSQESARESRPGLARGQFDCEIKDHGPSSQGTIQGPNQGFNPSLPLRLHQPAGSSQEYAQQQTEEQAVSRSPAPTPSALRNGTWRPRGQQQGEEAGQDTAEGTTQLQGTCRDFNVLDGQKSAAKGPQTKTKGSRRATTRNTIKKSTSHTAPPINPSDCSSLKRQRKL